jgi:hypothetical protein
MKTLKMHPKHKEAAVALATALLESERVAEAITW